MGVLGSSEPWMTCLRAEIFGVFLLLEKISMMQAENLYHWNSRAVLGSETCRDIASELISRRIHNMIIIVGAPFWPQLVPIVVIFIIHTVLNHFVFPPQSYYLLAGFARIRTL
jgi:hypothetical protein